MTLALAPAPDARSAATPFDLRETETYRRWREAKLAAYPRGAAAVVEIGDPRALSRAEHEALLERCRRYNFAVYASRFRGADKDAARLLGRQFGLTHLDRNALADDDGVTPLAVCAEGARSGYIPYTDRAIRWHTDGYYNPPGRQVAAMILHCVSEAESGGENAFLDHELAYVALRDADPRLVQALMAPDAMTIPAGVDEAGVVRAARIGPVFRVDPHGDLHMRYTARTRSVVWRQDATTAAAVALLAATLEDSRHVVRVRLTAGMGVIANNVLHARAAFRDGGARRRLLYRARYCERIAGTEAAYAQITAGRPGGAGGGSRS